MSRKGYLTAEEYTAIRKLLGFTQQEAAEFHKVQNIRTIQRWEKGDSWVSEIACDKIMSLYKTTQAVIDEAVKQWEKSKAPVALIIYPDSCYKQFVVGIGDLPNNVHRAMIERLYFSLSELGADVDIVTFNPQLYLMYLAEKGLTDTQDARGAWAAEYAEEMKKEI